MIYVSDDIEFLARLGRHYLVLLLRTPLSLATVFLSIIHLPLVLGGFLSLSLAFLVEPFPLFWLGFVLLLGSVGLCLLCIWDCICSLHFFCAAAPLPCVLDLFSQYLPCVEPLFLFTCGVSYPSTTHSAELNHCLLAQQILYFGLYLC